ncbi:unnamed protein product [Phytomonas sp. EM1]|nr:unnamed protein product [Phytomonas sp. EM1]|eukprot:CCW65539.1 unnamed protein product [Phytomonas sp. isolate EM1]
MRGFLTWAGCQTRGCASAGGPFSSFSRRSITTPGVASYYIPRQMVQLPIRDSEALVEEIAEAYVSMDLPTQELFRRAATKKMTGEEESGEAVPKKPGNPSAPKVPSTPS